ncbi:hypothetical protein [Burkholderia cepacia]|uniref:hypothetical protein n=1 Tax=Burkholderia cepacia TaxID=292 RepID=UPI00158EF77E
MKDYDIKRGFVDGNAIFPGSRPCERLVTAGHDVPSVEHFHTGHEGQHRTSVQCAECPADAPTRRTIAMTAA